MLQSSYSVASNISNTVVFTATEHSMEVAWIITRDTVYIQGKIAQGNHVCLKIFYFELCYQWNIFGRIISEVHTAIIYSHNSSYDYNVLVEDFTYIDYSHFAALTKLPTGFFTFKQFES